MISKLQQAGSCPAHGLWPGRPHTASGQDVNLNRALRDRFDALRKCRQAVLTALGQEGCQDVNLKF